MSEEKKDVVKKLADLGLSEDFLESEGFKGLSISEDVEITDEIEAKIKEAKEKWEKDKENSGGEKSGQGDSKGQEGQKEGSAGKEEQGENQEEVSGYFDEKLDLEGNDNKEDIHFVAKEGDVNVDQDWVQRYEAIMKQYAADNQKEWVREEKDEEGNPYEGLKGKIGEADYHFSAPDKAKSNLAGIDGVISLAAKTGQAVAFNEGWSDEFKAEVMKACEKYGVSLQGKPEQAKENVEEKAAAPAPASVERPVVKEDYENTYRVDSFIASTKIKGLYVRTDDANESKKNTKIKALEAEVKKEEELLAGRAYQVTGEEKATSDLLIKKYVLAQRQGNKEMADTCALALQRYGVDEIKEDSKTGTKVTTKPYSERTDEEKANIDAALDKSLPKKQEQYNSKALQPQQIAQAKQAEKSQ